MWIVICHQLWRSDMNTPYMILSYNLLPLRMYPMMRTLEQDQRIAVILQVMKDVERSPLPVRQYFKETLTPFGRVQYYQYKKAIAQSGIQGLCDHRSQGNHVKFTDEMKHFVKGVLAYHRSMPSSDVHQAIIQEFGVSVSLTVLHDFRRAHELSRCPDTGQKSGASELLIALALESGFIETFTDVIYQHVQRKKASERFTNSVSLPPDHCELRSQGRFTAAYNRSAEVSGARFQSVEEKRGQKRLASMAIFSHSKATFLRYTLALLSLPLVTGNGRVRSVDNPKGNALAYLCGYNCKATTLNKYLREVKYLHLADELMVATARFWIDFWSRRNGSKTMFACYYIDGNSKALWSSKPGHKGKVTMLGRVMNCLEQVFIHDGQGHPIYFETFNGHADLGKNALRMMDRLSSDLNETMDSAEPFSVNRILIFDGAGNGVRTLRGLCQSAYHFITILDDNQVTDRKLKSESPRKRYAYGDAYVVDCVIELEDSQEKGDLFETRAVQVQWDNQRTSVLITSLAKELFSVDHVVKSYFDRWPMQELDFKDMKSLVNIHRVVGYGKKSVANTAALEKIDHLQAQIQKLEKILAAPLDQIHQIEEELRSQIQKERIYREKSKLVDGKRKLSERDAHHLKALQKEINRLMRHIKTIEKADAKRFTSLKKKRTELARIIDKKKIYQVDVELAQIMTCFKISFANLCCYLLTECFNSERMTLQRLFDMIFDLPAQMWIEDKQRHILIERNSKQKEMMKKLEDALEIINRMKITDINGNMYNFKVVQFNPLKNHK